MALPFLECMLPGVAKAAAAPIGGAPRRMVFFYLPNGMDMDNWTPAAMGDKFELPSILQPLEPLRKHVSVLSGLAHVNARALGDGAGDHARANACFLTGVHPRKTAGSDISVGVSADQIAALQISPEKISQMYLSPAVGLAWHFRPTWCLYMGGSMQKTMGNPSNQDASVRTWSVWCSVSKTF